MTSFTAFTIIIGVSCQLPFALLRRRLLTTTDPSFPASIWRFDKCCRRNALQSSSGALRRLHSRPSPSGSPRPSLPLAPTRQRPCLTSLKAAPQSAAKMAVFFIFFSQKRCGQYRRKAKSVLLYQFPLRCNAILHTIFYLVISARRFRRILRHCLDTAKAVQMKGVNRSAEMLSLRPEQVFHHRLTLFGSFISEQKPRRSRTTERIS